MKQTRRGKRPQRSRKRTVRERLENTTRMRSKNKEKYCKRLDLCLPQWVYFGSQKHHETP
jgi:hypothetical protein